VSTGVSIRGFRRNAYFISMHNDKVLKNITIGFLPRFPSLEI
jgi:hypothetical protein